MSLLKDIQDAAIDEKSQVATLLRKCKVLATRLGSIEFGRWVDNELNGYSNLSELPAYRILHVRSYGQFVGFFGRQMNNAPIPPMSLPEEIREYVETSKLNMPISALAELAGVEAEDGMREDWPADAVVILGRRIYQDMNCLGAWKWISRAALVSILDTVRTRVLNFALEIEAESPDAGEAAVNSEPVPQDRVHQIFNTYITGNVQNVATGSTNVRQKAISTGPNDDIFLELLDALGKANADQEVMAELVSTVEEMRGSQGMTSFKQHYQSFMSVLADHMQVFGPVVAPFLPALAAMVP